MNSAVPLAPATPGRTKLAWPRILQSNHIPQINFQEKFLWSVTIRYDAAGIPDGTKKTIEHGKLTSTGYWSEVVRQEDGESHERR